MADWVVYILRCADNSFYTGITTDLQQRLQKHSEGTGAKYTRGRGPFEIVFSEPHLTRGAALKRELEIKALDRAAKEKLAGASKVVRSAL